MADCPSRLTLALLKTGDLQGESANEVIAHIDGCEACQNTAADLDANVATFESHQESHLQKLRARIDAEVASPDRRVRRLSKKRVTIIGSLTAVAAAAALVLFSMQDPLLKSGDDDIQFKGNISLQVVAKRDDRQFTVRDGTALFMTTASTV